ncbi:MAG: nuclear transport factor 2 family protein [Thaumarchaeota archaeon]|nr:nuclear transport factor 2 family protein [Nitrososphaerota archaeon]
MNNVELVKKFYILFGKQDKSFLELCDDSIEWTVMKNMPNGGTHVGKKNVFDGYFPKLFAKFAEFHVVTDEFIETGNRVIVLGTYKITSKSGKKFDAPFVHIYTIQDGKIVKFRQYSDTVEIQNAAK